MRHPDDAALQRFADGEHDEAEGLGALVEHLGGCARCSAVVSSVRHLGGAVRLWSEEMEAPSSAEGVSLVEAVMAAARPLADPSMEPSLDRPAEPDPRGELSPGALRALPKQGVMRGLGFRRAWLWPALAAAAAVYLVAGPRPGRGPRRSDTSVRTPGVLGLAGVATPGAEVVRIEVEGAKSYAVMEVPGNAPGTLTAVVWIQDEPEDSMEPSP